MKVSELISLLQTKPQDMEVAFLDAARDSISARVVDPKHVVIQRFDGPDEGGYMDGAACTAKAADYLFIGWYC